LLVAASLDTEEMLVAWWAFGVETLFGDDSE
jgi:hypothetical protein